MKKNYLIAYDIREPKRLGRIHYFISKKATAMQNSVFLIIANQSDLKTVTDGLLDRADTQVDDIRLYPLQSHNQIWVAGQQAEKMSGIYPSFATKVKPSIKSRFIKRLFGAE